jgi:uncharacterized protein (DUF924 family)
MSKSTLVMQILNFWFGDPSSSDYGQPQPHWFNSTPELDQNVRDTFGHSYEQASKGELDEFKKTPEGSLALILIFDQFSRNMFRGTPQVYAMDTQAVEIAKEAIQMGFDQELTDFQRKFIYMPFMHSEDLKEQNKSVELFESLGEEATLKYALSHRDIVARFGRFPHRNGILNRESTPQEIAFLKEPGSSF